LRGRRCLLHLLQGGDPLGITRQVSHHGGRAGNRRLRKLGRQGHGDQAGGLAILSGDADTGIATGATANLLGLSFVPIADESFDMVVGESTYLGKGVQTFIEMIRSTAFLSRAERLCRNLWSCL